MRCLCFFLGLLLSPGISLAQYENLLHKTYAQKANGLHVLFKDLLAANDSVTTAKKSAEFRRFAYKNNDRELELEIDLFLAYRYAFFNNLPQQQAIRSFKDLIETATRENIWHIKIRARRALSEYYWKFVKNYELAFEQYFVLDKELTSIQSQDYPEMARDLMQIGESYYFFHDYALARKYLKRALALPETGFNSILLNSSRNTIGLCFQHERQYDSSNYYFNQVLLTKFDEARMAWERIAKGNIGANYYYQNEYDKAIPLLKYDFNGAVKTYDYGPAGGAAILLADIFVSRGELQKSGIYIRSAAENIKMAGQQERFRLLYPVISKWYNAKGNRKLSQSYMDSTVMAIEQYHQNYNAIKVLRAQQKINLQQEQLRLAEFTLENQKKTNQRNLLIGIVTCLCFFMALGYYIQRKRQLAKDLTIQAANRELEIATINLNQFTESISDKNRLIEDLMNQKSDGEKNNLIYKLQQSTILTELEWQSFQRMFETVYPGFINRARQVYPELSAGEIRYFLLSKLNLSYKEMAAMLGVSPNTVQVLRHRMRKKLDFSDNAAMEHAIKRI